jgi:hypothetical protein
MWHRIALALLGLIVVPAVLAGGEYNVPFSPKGGFARVLAGQHYNDTSSPDSCASSNGEDETSPWVACDSQTGTPQNNYATGAMEGAQMLRLSKSSTETESFIGIHDDVSAGVIVWQWDWEMDDDGGTGIIWRTNLEGSLRRWSWIDACAFSISTF